MDDIILTKNSTTFLNSVIAKVAATFSIKDLGDLSYFLGIEVIRNSDGIFLSQRKYVHDLLQSTKMANAKSTVSPMAIVPSLSVSQGTPLSNSTEYRSVVGNLQYLSLTRPDVAFVVNRLAQYMHKPTDIHWVAVKRLLRYLAGSCDLGLFFHSSSPLSLHVFSDADWAGNPNDRTSTSAHLVFLGNNLISWSSKKQKSVVRSSTKAEYWAIASATPEIMWLQSLMHELGVSLPSTPPIYCDNIGATYLCANHVYHSRMKHIAIDFHFVRQKVQVGNLRISHVSSADQLEDALTRDTKCLDKTLVHSSISAASLQDWCAFSHHLKGAY